MALLANRLRSYLFTSTLSLVLMQLAAVSALAQYRVTTCGPISEPGVQLRDNTASSNDDGFTLIECNACDLTNNQADRNGTEGFYVFAGSNDHLMGNRSTSNRFGIFVQSSHTEIIFNIGLGSDIFDLDDDDSAPYLKSRRRLDHA